MPFIRPVRVTAAAPAVPAWRTGMAVNEWKELSGTSLSNITIPVAGTTPAGRVDAWGCITVIGSKAYSFNGGHNDYWGTEVYELDASINTPAVNVLGPNTIQANAQDGVEYYNNGLPSSTHHYYGIHGVASQGRIYRLGMSSVWSGTGGINFNNVDGFTINGGTWNTANTYADSPELINGGFPQAQHPSTEDVYVCALDNFYRWNASTQTFTSRTAMLTGGNQGATLNRPGVVDSTQNLFIVFGDVNTANTAQVFNISGNSWSRQTLTGAANGTATAGSGHGAIYDPDGNRYLVKTSTGSEIVQVTTGWVATTLSTSGGGSVPNATPGNGSTCLGRWKYSSTLKGVFYLPIHSGNYWFFATDGSL